MPIAYFKCSCGNEQRKIVRLDKTGFVEQPDGRWKFDPSAPKTEPPVRSVDCSVCGNPVLETPDPQAVRSFMQLNWLES